jgi:hypothetical protein
MQDSPTIGERLDGTHTFNDTLDGLLRLQNE